MTGKKVYLVDEKNKILRITEFLVRIALVAVIALFLTSHLAYTKQTESRSMEPDIQPNSVIFMNRFAYILSPPNRFEPIGFFRSAEDPGSDVLVRMVVGLPGERIRITKGQVFINDEILDVSSHIGNITSDGIAETEILLNEDEYFVLGTNPQNSEDSRSSTVGNVERRQIMGRAWLVVRSITDMKILH